MEILISLLLFSGTECSILESNNINKPQVGFLKNERLKFLLNQANYCKVAKFNNEFSGFLLCLPEYKEYDSPNYQWVSKRYSNFVYIDRIFSASKISK